jgi:hypothetical protein
VGEAAGERGETGCSTGSRSVSILVTVPIAGASGFTLTVIVLMNERRTSDTAH